MTESQGGRCQVSRRWHFAEPLPQLLRCDCFWLLPRKQKGSESSRAYLDAKPTARLQPWKEI